LFSTWTAVEAPKALQSVFERGARENGHDIFVAFGQCELRHRDGVAQDFAREACVGSSDGRERRCRDTRLRPDSLAGHARMSCVVTLDIRATCGAWLECGGVVLIDFLRRTIAVYRRRRNADRRSEPDRGGVQRDSGAGVASLRRRQDPVVARAEAGGEARKAKGPGMI
jgi:hypothetical protein